MPLDYSGIEPLGCSHTGSPRFTDLASNLIWNTPFLTVYLFSVNKWWSPNQFSFLVILRDQLLFVFLIHILFNYLYPRKTCGYGQPRSHLIRVLNERKERKWRRRFLSSVAGYSQISLIVSETHFSCDTVDRGLWLAILSSLLCPETDRNIRIGK